MTGASEPFQPSEGMFKVRPYALTNGRTRAVLDLGLDTTVRINERGAKEYDTLPLIYREILLLTLQPTCIAEISARERLAIGATKVLVADLVSENMLDCSAPATPTLDVDLMRKVVDGLNEL